MHQYERKILLALKNHSSFSALESVAEESKLARDSVLRFAQSLKESGAVEVRETVKDSYELTEEGKRFSSELLPELRVLARIREGGEVSAGEFTQEEKSIGIPWAKKKGWIFFGERGFKLTKDGENARAENYEQMSALKRIAVDSRVSEEEKESAELLMKRGSVLKKEQKSIELKITAHGKELAEIEETQEGEEEINVLTRELIISGEWKKKKLREYDVEAGVEKAQVGKEHPLRTMNERMRAIFSELGFEEMKGEVVESSFWNFDALFQPQDHPARELADTFYLKTPEKLALPSDEIVARVKKAHEKGWKYKWKREIAEQAVLRTHTTAVSARYLVDTRDGKRKAPAKYFSIGKVYRNEATDYKHLAEFFQVEGIVVWEDASFADLLGILKEFYRKLGFEKIRFRPSFFPYTEPSLEIEVWFEEKKAWLEFGGAGVFRPEVCIPLWGKYPVLAWGLSLERPLMLKLGLNDIRTFCRNDVNWLREAKLGER
ncbi:MAG: phenylalanine--tRNA ligase subunit alpha [Candidatus Micrarchaeota archaeon]